MRGYGEERLMEDDDMNGGNPKEKLFTDEHKDASEDSVLDNDKEGHDTVDIQ